MPRGAIRHWLRIGAIAMTLALVAAGCGGTEGEEKDSGGGKPPSRLVVSVWSGIYQEFFQEFVEPAFHEDYPNVEIVYDLGGMSARYNKLLAQGKSSEVDLFASTGEFQDAAVQQGLLRKIDTDAVPNAEKLNDWAKPTQPGFGPAWGGVSVGLAYSPAAFSSPPTSWKDLWEPEVQGKIVVPAAEHSVMPAFLAKVTDTFNNDSSISSEGSADKDIAPGLKALAELDPLTTGLFYTDWVAQYQSGNVLLAAEYDNYVDLMRREGADMIFAVPEEGALGQALYMDVTTGADGGSAEVAAAFINAALTDAAQQGVAEGSFRGAPSVSGITLSEDVAKSITIYNSPDKVAFFPAPVARRVRGLWSNMWNTEVTPKWG